MESESIVDNRLTESPSRNRRRGLDECKLFLDTYDGIIYLTKNPIKKGELSFNCLCSQAMRPMGTRVVNIHSITERVWPLSDDGR